MLSPVERLAVEPRGALDADARTHHHHGLAPAGPARRRRRAARGSHAAGAVNVCSGASCAMIMDWTTVRCRTWRRRSSWGWWWRGPWPSSRPTRAGGARATWATTFCGCLLGLVCVQWYYVFLAANHAPPSIMPAHTRRHDCLAEPQGRQAIVRGQAEPGGVAGLDVNPCFCHPYARCFDPLTGYVYHEAPTRPTLSRENSLIQCPTDRSARAKRGRREFSAHPHADDATADR